jgi:hypothetical protein
MALWARKNDRLTDFLLSTPSTMPRFDQGFEIYLSLPLHMSEMCIKDSVIIKLAVNVWMLLFQVGFAQLRDVRPVHHGPSSTSRLRDMKDL